MGKIKGINKITRELNSFLKANNFNCKASYGKEWEILLYRTKMNKISWTFYTDNKEHDEMFKDLFHNLGLRYDFNIFILSFFHELGHHCTDLLLTNGLELSYEEFLKRDNSGKTSNEIAWEYFNCYEEKLATRWAVRYINDNENKVKQLWKNIQPKLLEVYKINNFIKDN